MDSKMIITGGTGTIGRELVRLLSERDTAATALTRRPPADLDVPGITWVEADLSDRAILPDVFSGADQLFLLTANSEDMVRLQKNAIRAAREAGISHIVKLSALGATDHSKSIIGLWHFNVERELKASGLDWTILRPHHFMQNLLDQAPSIIQEGVVRSPSGEGRIPFIDTRDIAAVAAAVLSGTGREGATYVLTGPEARSYRDATEMLSEALQRPLRYVPETDDEAWARLRSEGSPPWQIAALLGLAGYQRAGGPTEIVTDTVERVTGRPARTLHEFIRDHQSAFV